MARILIVDDQEHIRQMLGYLLENHGHVCSLAADAEEAEDRVREQDFDLVLCDVDMPGMGGIELVRLLLSDHPNTAAVMVTGIDDPDLINVALEVGAYGYIVKPFGPHEVLINVANALRRRTLEIENRAHRTRLEQLVQERTARLQDTVQQLERAERELMLSREETIQRLAKAAECRDDETAQHIVRMSRYCALLARLAGQSQEHCELIRIASPMHDVGKIGIPDHILLKPGRHTREEFEIMKQHAELGYRILDGSGAPLLNLAATIARTHHERFDGTGYPRGLYGEEIPLEGRITAIADVFDALTSRRCYKEAFPIDKSLELMRAGRGTHFDPRLLDLFIEALPEVLHIRNQYLDGPQE